jgi:hypothetical protein
MSLPAHMGKMLVNALLFNYAAWIFATSMFIWLGSVVYRSTQNTLNAAYDLRQEEEEIAARKVLRIPRLPRRARSVPYANAA